MSTRQRRQDVPIRQGQFRVLITCLNQIGIYSRFSFMHILQGAEGNYYLTQGDCVTLHSVTAPSSSSHGPLAPFRERFLISSPSLQSPHSQWADWKQESLTGTVCQLSKTGQEPLLFGRPRGWNQLGREVTASTQTGPGALHSGRASGAFHPEAMRAPAPPSAAQAQLVSQYPQGTGKTNT